ncbi:HNH endonuclease [Ruminiclostridium cellulolyticum]|nr:HNH endonuclease [Ruminiclostridium cellulolyticum]
MGIGKAGGSKVNSKGDAKGERKGGGPKGGGDFLGILLSGIHTKLYAIGLRNIVKLGKNLASKVAGGAKAIIGKMLTPKVKFKLGNESHELRVEKGKNKNVVMMASTPDLFENKIKEGKVPDNGEIRDKETIVKKNPNEGTVKDLGKAVQKAKGKTPAERAEKKGYKGIGTTKNGGPDFASTEYLYPVKEGQRNIVTIKMTGDRGRDFTQAFDEAKIPSRERKSIKENYTWHHADDFDPKSGTCSMQLVQKEAHEATYTHKGSCAQYDEYHNEKIYNK